MPGEKNTALSEQDQAYSAGPCRQVLENLWPTFSHALLFWAARAPWETSAAALLHALVKVLPIDKLVAR